MFKVGRHYRQNCDMERSKSFVVKKAVEQYIITTKEDAEDIKAALQALEAGGSICSLEEMMEELGIEHDRATN
ncbi:MAG: hypothetical protein COA94_07570 [Rickettsiales bacterium]|nr:MAG: hypothetical protein COA94_07570 [Rickettsiales bacterium]